MTKPKSRVLQTIGDWSWVVFPYFAAAYALALAGYLLGWKVEAVVDLTSLTAAVIYLGLLSSLGTKFGRLEIGRHLGVAFKCIVAALHWVGRGGYRLVIAAVILMLSGASLVSYWLAGELLTKAFMDIIFYLFIVAAVLEIRAIK